MLGLEGHKEVVKRPHAPIVVGLTAEGVTDPSAQAGCLPFSDGCTPSVEKPCLY